MHRGYIKIWRKIRESFIWQDSDCFKIFSHLIMEANYKDTETIFNDKKLIIKRGQLICGRHQLEHELGINQHKIYRMMELLENEQVIEQQKTSRCTIVTIVCYDDYNSNEQQNEQLVSNERATGEQLVSTSKTSNTTKKEDNNTSNKKDDYEKEVLEHFDHVWKLYPKKEGRAMALKHFRAQIRTEEDWDSLLLAIKNYTDKIDREGTMLKFVKNGSTFFNQNWRDYAVKEDS